jgi:UDP-3-O-[3-hydroxymyristoyl] glucosamine N-acyltransferase
VDVTVKQLAALVQGQISGPDDVLIQAARPIHEAGPGDITFVENDKKLKHWKGCRASAVVVPAKAVARVKELNGTAGGSPSLLVVADALTAFITIAQHLHGEPPPPPHGRDPLACIDPSAELGPDASVFPFAVIGAGTRIGARCRIHSGVVIGRNCRIGDDVLLYPNVVIYDGVTLGHRVIVHASAVLGADGFGYRMQQGKHVKIPQLGSVELGDDVEIGAGTTIDRGTFQATRIGTGTKIDNLVQIGHNCLIGKHNLLVSQVGIAGSCTTGDYVVLAGQVGISDHLHIGDQAQVAAQGGVMRDVPAGGRVSGSPAWPIHDQQRMVLCITKLPAMYRDMQRIKEHLGMADTEDPGARTGTRALSGKAGTQAPGASAGTEQPAN